MKTRKLVSMIDYILDIDFMTTKEFCETFDIPLPTLVNNIDGGIDVKKSADKFLQIDAIKQKMFVEYAKFLNKELTIDMFEGEKKIFEGGHYVNLQPSHEWNYYGIKGMKIFQDSNTSVNCSLGKKIKDLTELGLSYIGV